MDTSDKFTFSLGNAMLAMVPLAAMIGLVKSALEYNNVFSGFSMALALFAGPPLMVGAFLGGGQGMRQGAMISLILIGIVVVGLIASLIIPMILFLIFQLFIVDH
jgi:hypothetical protein